MGNLNQTQRPFLEIYGSTVRTNSFLKLVLFVLCLALVGSMALSAWAVRWALNQKPLVIRIDEVGRATAVDYRSFAYSPAESELRYFLATFVQLHFSRLVGSVEGTFARSAYFLDAKVSEAIMEAERKSQSIGVFMKEGAEEIDVEIKNIALQDLKANPMKATVDFEKVYFVRGQRREVRRERFAGYFEFIVQEHVPNTFILVNPLGITITYFRVDPAFKP